MEAKGVSSLAKRGKRAYDVLTEDESRAAALDSLLVKLQAAQERREALLQARRAKTRRHRVKNCKSPPHSEAQIRAKSESQQALQQWHTRLAAAEAKRNEALERIRIRAAATTSRCAHVVRAAKKKQEVEARARLSRLIRKLERAAESRAARLHAHRDRRQRRALSSIPGNAESVVSENKVAGASAGCSYSAVYHAAARTVQTHWRAVLHSSKNTAALVEGFQKTGLARTVQRVSSPQTLAPPGEQSVESFDQIAEMLSSPSTIKATASLLERIECLWHIVAHGDSPLNNSSKHKRKHRHGQVHHNADGGKHSSRYQVRPFLSAYMILTHPHVILNGATRKDDFRLLRKEAVLWAAAKALISSFHGFKAVFLASVRDQLPLRPMVTNFEQSWVHYIHQFHVWKGRDAMALEAQLIQAAMELEGSRRIKLASRRPSTDKRASDDDMRALSEGVDHDLDLIGRRVFQLTGKRGATRLEVALKAINAQSSVEAQSMPSSSSISSSASSSPEGGRVMYMDSNIGLAWQLLYDKSWRISSEALEREWELLLASSFDEESTTSDTLKGKEENQSVLLQPLMDAVDGVPTLLPPPTSAGKVDYRQEVAHLEEEIKTLLSSATSTVEEVTSQVVELLDAAFRLALVLGLPARDGPAKEAYHALHKGLSHPANDPIKSFTLKKAVKLVSIQWRLLRVDLANTYLTSFATKLEGGEYQDLYDYARTKLNVSVSNVPNTLAWMALSSSRAALLPTGVVDPGSAKATIKETFQCPKLRSGRTLGPKITEKAERWDSSIIGNDTMEGISSPTENWQRTLRVGLVLWIAGQGPLTKIELPETLRLDVARLHAAKVEFQRTLVLGIVLDLDLGPSAQHANSGTKKTSNSSVAGKLDMKRLRAILASPDIDIDDIVTEVVSQKGRVTHGSTKGETDKERGVRDVLKSMLSPHSIAIQDWTEYLTDELIQQVICLGGNSHDHQHHQYHQHQHDLIADVHSIGSIILKIASVHERVLGDLYRGLDQSLSA